MQQQQLKVPPGPDLLLPLIDPLSTITWSDLRSKNASADSLEGVGYSFRTDDATTSHPGFEDMADMGRDDAQMSPDAVNLSPTPPGLPSKIGASTATAGPSYSSTSSSSADALHAGMYPLSPVSPVFTMSRSASRSRSGTARPGMEPVIEDGSSSRDKPQLRQLPSPPSSPDQYEPNYRSSASRRRPSVTASLTAPSALPYRPRSSTTTSVPLSAAFQTSLLSGNQVTHASAAAHAQHRYPSLAVPAPRSRASSVSLEPIPDLSPLERPTDAARRMSTTELRHRHPSSIAATQGSHGTRTLSHPTTQGSHSYSHSSTHGSHAATQGSHSGDQPRVERIPEHGEPGLSSWQHQSMQLERSSPLFMNSPSPLSPPPSARPFRPLPVPGAQSPSRPATMSSQPQPQSQQHLPPLVRKRESPALRPLPASPFLQTSSSSGHSRQPSAASTRTRSNSVMSERSLPRHLPPLAPLPPLEFDSDFPPHGDSRNVSSRGKLK
ncbi:hypothetical protein DAEQUDRAFT_726367 [Daedalea quercina L-15889]|uniref:Uncharacterized protein n=1 Tax=Daedalea quercina L-15889 TaxID=1314783 RepID=A0A165QNH8_9APHY|nr:hypothetical protein DAEQUDRAFT_726367 [Daedalea quercina L-15889]